MTSARSRMPGRVFRPSRPLRELARAVAMAAAAAACAPYLGGQREQGPTVPDRGPSPASPAATVAPVPPAWLILTARRERDGNVDLEVRNPGATSVRLPRPLEPYFRVERIEASRWVPCTPAPLPARVDFFDLGPGERVEVRLDVGSRCVFADGPVRRAGITLDVPPGTDEYRNAPGAWTGRTERAVVDFERSR